MWFADLKHSHKWGVFCFVIFVDNFFLAKAGWGGYDESVKRKVQNIKVKS